MKSKITVTKKNDKINFFLHTKGGRFFLFSQCFSKGVYEFFCKGKSKSEIKSFRKWNRNPRLDKTIEKISLYVKYVRKEVIPAESVGNHNYKPPTAFDYNRLKI